MKAEAWFYQFLRKTQKYTKTDNVYLVKSGFWLNLGGVISSATSFLLAIALANLLDPTTYGNYKYIVSVAGSLSIFTLSGLGAAIIQATARGLEGSFYSAFKTKLKLGVLGSLAAVGIAVYYWFQGNEQLTVPLLVIAVFLPLMEASKIYGSFLSGKKLFNFKTRYNALSQIVFVVVMLIVLLLTKNLVWLIAAYFGSHTLSNYFFYLFTRKKFKPNKKEDPKSLPYGLHLSLIALINTVANYLDKILLFTLAGPVQLAVYSFAITVPEEIKSIFTSINVLALPKLAAREQKEIKTTIMKKIGKLFLLIVPIIAFYILLAPYVYKIFFPQYLNSVPYSQVFIFSLLFFPTTLLGTAFKAKMMKREIYLLKAITPLVRIGLFAVLIPFYGIWGVIMAILGTGIFGVGLSLFLFRKF